MRELAAQPVQMSTCCGESMVSEKITVVPSGETARGFPATFCIGDTLLPPESTIAPLVPKAVLSTPKYSFAPKRSNNAELGANGKGTGTPAVKGAVALARVIGTTCVLQVVAIGLHPVEVTYTVGLPEAPVPEGRAVTEIAGAEQPGAKLVGGQVG